MRGIVGDEDIAFGPVDLDRSVRQPCEVHTTCHLADGVSQDDPVAFVQSEFVGV